MGAPLGNRFWEARSSHGRNPKFRSPDHMWEAACEYFEWVEDNPLIEEKAWHANGVVTKDTIHKMRAMTIDGLIHFLDISDACWYDYCSKNDYSSVTGKIKNVIRSQKFAGAAADLLNANIIARDLGLKDASATELTGPNGGPIQAQDVPLTKEQEEMLKKAQDGEY